MTYKFSTGSSVTGGSYAYSRRKLALISDQVGFPGTPAYAGGPGSTTLVQQTAQMYAGSWMFQALMRMGWPYELVTISTLATRTTAQIVGAFAAEVAAFTPGEVWISTGRNDLTSAATAAAALVQVDALIAACLASNPGMIIRIATVPPGDATSNTTAYQQALSTFNYGLMRRAQTNSSVQVVDIAAVVRDPASVTGQAKSGAIQSDHAALAILYAALAGDFWSTAVTPLLPSAVSMRPSGNLDYFAGNANSFRLIPNPNFAGSGGTGGAGISGTIPASWQINAGNSVTVVSSVTTDATTVANARTWWNLVLGGTASAATDVQGVIAIANPTSSIVTINTTLARLRMDFKTTSLVNVASISLHFQIGGVSFTYPMNSTMLADDAQNQTSWPANFTLELPSCVVPDLNNWQAFFTASIRSGVAPTGTLSMSQPLLEVVV